MKRFHAAGICDCCDAPPEDELGENPNYGPGNPDWERDFEKDGHSEGRLQPAPISTPRQGGRTMSISQPTVATGGQDTSYRLWVNEARTVLFRLWASGEAEVATRESPDHTWGPPVSMRVERP